MAGIVRFGAFEFDPRRRVLRKHGLKIRVPGQSLEILAALVEQPGETVTRQRIQELLWPHGTVVGYEPSINAAVKRLREALGDPAENGRYIERVRGQGYRFSAPVEEVQQTGSPPPAPVSDLAGTMLLHYRLIEKLGSGSMGEVWKAEDTRLGRTVAIKFIPERLAADPEALEAFRAEARSAAALNHPNICTVYGFEEQDGRWFLVMEYIPGTPLSAILQGEPLPARRIIDTGIQVSGALAAAHRAGIVHRDVKPSNLMIAGGGTVKLTDFGVAQNVSKPLNGRASSPAGTLAYLSPEQARGETADARSDLFSLGIVLYEMATGKTPFSGDTPASVLRSRREEVPALPRRLNSKLPRKLERVILKSLAKDAGERWQNASEMGEALKRAERNLRLRSWAWRAAAAACVIVALAYAGWRWRRTAPALSERNSIVIAGFENTTGDVIFDSTLRQALRAQLGQSPYLSIVPEERIRTALGLMQRPPDDPLTRLTALEVCQRLGEKAIVAGSIGKVGSRYFVGLETLDCATGEAVASEFAGAESREGVLAALGEAAASIRRRLGESLGSIRKHGAPVEVTTTSLEALKAYNIALAEKASGSDALPLLRRALELDPKFASAWFTLSQVFFNRGQQAKAEEAISTAYALRERTSDRERLFIENYYQIVATGNLQQALAAGTLASQLFPNDAAARRSVFLPACVLGEYEQALQLTRREVELAPKEGVSYFNLALSLILFNRSAEARQVLDQAAAHGVSADVFPAARYILAVLDGDFAGAERQVESMVGKPVEPRVLMLWAQTAMLRGQFAKARGIARTAANELTEIGPAIEATVAAAEAVFGLERQASERAEAALRLSQSRRTGANAAFALALVGDPVSAEGVLDDLHRRYPNDTILNSPWSPIVEAAIALQRGDPRAVVEITRAVPESARFGWLSYLRGTAFLHLGHGAEASNEFRRILGRKGVLLANGFFYGGAAAYPAAQLGLARALSLSGDPAARNAYEDFLDGWSQADPKIPLLEQARREYAALQRSD